MNELNKALLKFQDIQKLDLAPANVPHHNESNTPIDVFESMGKYDGPEGLVGADLPNEGNAKPEDANEAVEGDLQEDEQVDLETNDVVQQVRGWKYEAFA